MCSVADLKKMEVTSFVSMFAKESKGVIERVSCQDNSMVQMLVTRVEMIGSVTLFRELVYELVRYYLG